MHALERSFAAGWPSSDWQEQTLLLAVSGGADSVALARAICALKTGGAAVVHIAHYNHALRGEASDADEQFVRELAYRLNVELHVEKADPPQSSARVAEATLRASRYRFLQHTAERVGARYAVTAHTRDDQAETVLHRIVRGTGIAGLAGMRRARALGDAVVLIRPMLDLARQDVLSYLQALEQSFCEDASNRCTSYMRNRIRHELLPLLARDYNAGIREALIQLAQLASDAQEVGSPVIEHAMEQSVRGESPQEILVDCGPLGTLDRAVVRGVLMAVWQRQGWPLRQMGFRWWNRLAAVALSAKPQILNLPGNVRAQKKGASLTLTRLL